MQHEGRPRLCIHARSGAHTDWPQARRFIQHGATCGAELGLVGENFADTCGQIDDADAMLDGFRGRASASRAHRRQAWPIVDGPRITALTRQDPDTQTVTLVLDVTTAIAARDTWVCTRPRAAERACRTTTERDIVPTPPEPVRAPSSGARTAAEKIEMEAEP
jgi:hypothetical protein